MISGGSEREVKMAGVARRPSIRPRPVTPPRVSLVTTPTWTLPPVRTPQPRIAKRLVLELVDPDESTYPSVTQVPSLVVAPSPFWKQPRTLALAVAAVLAAALTTIAVVWTASARREVAEATEAVGTTTLASASLAMPVVPVASPPSAKARVAPASPAIPVVDVNSLPSVPGRIASGASR